MFHGTSNRESWLMLLAATLMVVGFSPVAQAASADRLTSLIDETSAQFQLAYRMHSNEAQDRQEQLNEVAAAWRAAPRTAANDERLAKWLRAAIRTSMPGQREPLPPIPDFSGNANIKKRPAEPAPTEPTTSTTDEKRDLEVNTSDSSDAEPTPAIDLPTAIDGTTDPFRDDPIEEQE